MKSIKVCEYSRSRSFHDDLILQDQASGERSQDQWSSGVMLNFQLYAIWTWLPTRYAVCQPLLLYTSEEHGTSLMTLYTRVENYQPTVIVIKNTENEVLDVVTLPRTLFWYKQIFIAVNDICIKCLALF